jgi:hypothetical protein
MTDRESQTTSFFDGMTAHDGFICGIAVGLALGLLLGILVLL